MLLLGVVVGDFVGVVVGDLGGQHAAFSYPLGLGLLPHPLPYVTSAIYNGISQNPRSSASGRAQELYAGAYWRRR